MKKQGISEQFPDAFFVFFELVPVALSIRKCYTIINKDAFRPIRFLFGRV
jgi:hypothetical protein